MKQIIFRAFKQQIAFMQSTARIRGAFAGRRAGKTEVGAVEVTRCLHEKRGWKPSPIDPYTAIIVAPTGDMLRRLSMKKFLAYSAGYRKPGVAGYHLTNQEGAFTNGAVFMGISGDRPQRMEGVKANLIWIDEVLQVKEQLFLEAIARVSDQQGLIILTGSLGTDYPNPKAHWAYKYLKQTPLEGSECFEWGTEDNPYFPRAEIRRLKDMLDPVTYRQMFTLTWDGSRTNSVFEDFDDLNILKAYTVRPELQTFICVDWGFAHPMAVGFWQYDRGNDTAVQFDEIVVTRTMLDQLWDAIAVKIAFHKIRVSEWFCDIAGTQEREQTGRSNVRWFKEKHGIDFRFRVSSVGQGVSLVRSYIKDGMARRRMFFVEGACPKTIDCMRTYRYQDKDGVIVNENPVKQDDDPVDQVRYFAVNFLDRVGGGSKMEELNRWGQKW